MMIISMVTMEIISWILTSCHPHRVILGRVVMMIMMMKIMMIMMINGAVGGCLGLLC